MWVMGDIHGYRDRLTALLRDAGLLDDQLRWVGGGETLVLIGDLFDRGPDGAGAAALAMRLEGEAARAGGEALTLLGNHDALILSARVFGGAFLRSWWRNGGVERDLELLTPELAAWLAMRPAMALRGDTLLAHADATFYTRYGATIREVNAAMRDLLADRDADAWDRLLDDFSERHAFDGPGGAYEAARFLGAYGGRLLVHGHTPITKVTRQPPESVTGAHVYATGLCANTDGGMYLGGPGFLYRRDEGGATGVL